MTQGALIDIHEVETWEPEPERSADSTPPEWKKLYRAGALAALAIVVLVPLQIVVFVVWPPPATVTGFFIVFRSNPLRGLLDLDLMLILDELLMIPVLLGLYVALRRADASVMVLGAALGFVGAVLFVVSREATFSMLWLSQQYAAATAAADQATLLAAGQTMLTTYSGTAYIVGYFLSGLAMLVISVVMLRTSIFSRLTGWAGVIAGVTGLVPPVVGMIGLVLAFASLVPMVLWLVLIAQRFVQLARNDVGTYRNTPAYEKRSVHL